jgi:hypothetical protein
MRLDYELAFKSLIGMGSPALGVVTSLQEQIEWHLRVASLVVGLLVGLLTLLSLARKLWRKR